MRLLEIISLLVSSVHSIGPYSGGCPNLTGTQDFSLGYHFGVWKVAAYLPNLFFPTNYTYIPGQGCTEVTYKKTRREGKDIYFDIEHHLSFEKHFPIYEDYTLGTECVEMWENFPGYYNLNKRGLLKMAKNNETNPKTDGKDIVVFYQSIRQGVAYLFSCVGSIGVPKHIPIFMVVSKQGILSKREAEAHVRNAIQLLSRTDYSVTWASDVEYPRHDRCWS